MVGLVLSHLSGSKVGQEKEKFVSVATSAIENSPEKCALYADYFRFNPSCN
jgi:hypothetical protein